MKRAPLLLGLITGLLFLFGCAKAEVIVDKGPPPPKAEDQGKKPAGDVFWMDGHWAWDTGAAHFFWVGGRWAQPRPGRIWQNAYWEPIEGGKYRWVPERWDRTEGE